jgi:hypothetical protein
MPQKHEAKTTCEIHHSDCAGISAPARCRKASRDSIPALARASTASTQPSSDRSAAMREGFHPTKGPNTSDQDSLSQRLINRDGLTHYFQIHYSIVIPILCANKIYSVPKNNNRRFIWSRIWHFVGYSEVLFANEANHSLLKAPLINVAVASRVLGDSEATLKRYAARGEVPAKKVGKQWRFRTLEICWLMELPDDAAYTLHQQ